MSPYLTTQISQTLQRALHERAESSGQSISHIVQAALAEALDIQHHSLFQVSTSGAIVHGLYQGCVSVAELRRHGDLGLGTFEDLDGEMILLDGHCFQARADGTVRQAPDDALTPFATVVSFAADHIMRLPHSTLSDLTRALTDRRVTPNGIEAYRVTGTFEALELRAACRTDPGVDLVTATAHQSLFHRENITGTLVGFYSPEYMRSVSISGYHLHFLSDDRSCGGHVLGFTGIDLNVEINDVSHVQLAIPETTEFLKADLTEDISAALDIAERQVRGT